MTDYRDGPGWIYLIGRSDGWYRIGRTANLKERFQFYKYWGKINKWTLMPLFLIKVDNQELAERDLHRLFDDKRLIARRKDKGPKLEWFRLNSEDIALFVEFGQTIGEVTKAPMWTYKPYRTWRNYGEW